MSDAVPAALHAEALALLRSTTSPEDAWIETDWPLTPGVHAFSTTRLGPGNCGPPDNRFDLARATADPSDKLREALHLHALRLARFLPGAPVFVHQVHGARVLRVEAGHADVSNEPADALYTSSPDVVIGVRHADCLPLLLASVDGREVAAVHAGWRGLAAGVVENAIAQFAAAPEQIRCWMGPAIGAQRFEVGEDVYRAFVGPAADAYDAFRKSADGKWLCDLYLLARQRLHRLGVDQVCGGGLCTHSDARRFYSYRRDRATARMATLIWRSA